MNFNVIFVFCWQYYGKCVHCPVSDWEWKIAKEHKQQTSANVYERERTWSPRAAKERAIRIYSSMFSVASVFPERQCMCYKESVYFPIFSYLCSIVFFYYYLFWIWTMNIYHNIVTKYKNNIKILIV